MVVEEDTPVLDPVKDSLAAEEARNSGEGAVRSFEAEAVRNPAEVDSLRELVQGRTTS